MAPASTSSADRAGGAGRGGEAARGRGQARTRLDELVLARGLAQSRAEAARLILAGRVRLGADVADKAGRVVRADAPLALVAAAPYLSRGGEKLAAALSAFAIDVTGRVCLDVGASTGGFTDCLLQAGASRVHAVDVGHGQLHPRLRADPRVVVHEEANARHLGPERLGERVSLATIDVSFISLAKVLPAVSRCLAAPPGATGPEAVGAGTAPAAPERRPVIVALVKPQFEVGRGQVGKGGVVRDPALHAAAVRGVAEAARLLGLCATAVCASPLRGPKGNREFFLKLEPSPLAGADSDSARDAAAALEAALAAALEGPPAGGPP